MADPLRWVEPNLERATIMHSEADYGKMWVYMYECGAGRRSAHRQPVSGDRQPALPDGYHPHPRWDVPKLHMADTLYLFGAGREKRIYAVPPYTVVEPLQFEDYPFRTEYRPGQRCARCGAEHTFLTEHFVSDSNGGRWETTCSDAAYCAKRVAQMEATA